jgi:hypothetical protein
MSNVIWSKEEKEYLMSLALDNDMSVQDVVELLNEKFQNKRTKTAVSIQKHHIMKSHGLAKTKKPQGDRMEIKTKTIVPKRKKILGTQRNARRSWTTADEQMLVGQWTAGEKTQRDVAEKLGRSVKACQSHLSRLRRHNPELHMALINRGATINVLPATTEQYTLLDRMYVGLKFRKQNRMERKAAKAERKAAKRQAKLETKIAKLRGQL